MQPELNLPPADIRMNEEEIWDRLRKKYLKITPEEWVRQNFIAYLIDSLGYAEGRMISEYTVDYEGQKKRCDIAGFNKEAKAIFIVECKAPDVPLNEDTFYQVAKYNRVLGADLLILTNGLKHFCAQVDYKKGALNFLKKIPTAEELEDML